MRQRKGQRDQESRIEEGDVREEMIRRGNEREQQRDEE